MVPEQAQQIEIVNTLGQNVASFNVNGLTKKSFATQNWSKGMYFIQIKGQDGATMLTKKLIIE